MRTKKIFVVATMWSDEKKKQIKKIVGEFDETLNASLFKNAYNDFYKSDAKIVYEDELLNN